MNKSVIVTGGAKGIGRAIVEKFAQNGYDILINYMSSEEEATILKNNLLEIYPSIRIEIYKADVSNREQVKEMIKFTLDRFGKIDVLINNAGVSLTKLFTDISEKEFKYLYDINVFGTFNVSQEVIKSSMLKNKSGVIINISSIWGVCGASMEVLYSSSKAAIIGMSKALAKEMGPSNIRVNAVAPGWVETDMTSGYTDSEKQMFLDDIPLSRLGDVKDVANLVYFLSTDQASYISGQVISVDGGFLT